MLLYLETAASHQRLNLELVVSTPGGCFTFRYFAPFQNYSMS